MLYEEALYTILYRAGTMGPNQVDDQEALLGYLQQVSPLDLPTLLWEELPRTCSPTCRCHCHLNNTHRFAPCTQHISVCAQAGTHTG